MKNAWVVLSVVALTSFETALAQDQWQTRELRDDLPRQEAPMLPEGLTDAHDVVTAVVESGTSTLAGTASGALVEVSGGNVFRLQLCDAAVTSISYSSVGDAVYASCGGVVYTRDHGTSAWRRLAHSVPGVARSVVADPFTHGVFVGTTTGTYRVDEGHVERVAGPSSELRVVHFPTHTTVAGKFDGRTATLAKTTGCTIGVFDLSGRYNTTRVAHHFGYSYRTSIRVSSEACRWTIDIPNASPWLSFRKPGGSVWKRTTIDQLGSNDIEVIVARNTGYARTGTFTVSVGGNKVTSSVTQYQRTGLCMHSPRSTDGTPTTILAEGEFTILWRQFGTPTPYPNRMIYRLEDASRCHAEPIISAVSPALAGSTIVAVGNRPPAPTLVVLSTPLPRPSENAEVAVSTLRGNGGVGPSAVVSVLLENPTLLPVDLRNNGPTKPALLVFDNGGGRIDVEGTVSRSTKDPARTCAFRSSLYRVIGGDWLTVSVESGCNSKSPDAGKLVILAKPNGIGTRYAAIVSRWGWIGVVIQK